VLKLKGLAFWVKNLTRSYEGLLLLAAKGAYLGN